jgi:hypothetical protein
MADLDGMTVVAVEAGTRIEMDGATAVVDESHAVFGRGTIYVTPTMYERLKAVVPEREERRNG